MITWLNVALAVLILGLGLMMIDRMTRQTHCGIRWGIVLIAVGALFAVIGDIWKWEQWADTALRGGVATYLLANLRAPIAAVATSWGRRGAYVVATATVFAVVLAWMAPAHSQQGEAQGAVIVAPKAIERDQDAEINRIVEQLKRVYEFCKQQACTVIPQRHYEAIQRDMEELRRQLYELEKPRPSQAGCA